MVVQFWFCGSKLNVSYFAFQICLVTLQLRSIKHSFGSKFVLQCKEAVLVSAPSIIMQWNSRREGWVACLPPAAAARLFHGQFPDEGNRQAESGGGDGFVWNRRA